MEGGARKLVQPIALDPSGRPVFPIGLGGLTVYSLGEVSETSNIQRGKSEKSGNGVEPSLPVPISSPLLIHTNPRKSPVPTKPGQFCLLHSWHFLYSLWFHSLQPKVVLKTTTISVISKSSVTSIPGWGNLFYRSSPTDLASMMRMPSTLWATAVLECMPAWSAQTRSVCIPVRSRMVVCSLRYLFKYNLYFSFLFLRPFCVPGT